MTIRTRLTVWYTSVLTASIFLMAGVMYYELVIEPKKVIDAGKPPEPIEEEVAEIILYYGIPTALLTIGGGWFLMRKALAPLDRLSKAAERIQVDNLLQPLPRTGNGDEVDRLSEVLNTMTTRLNDSFNRIRDFTLHASHELKTPLAVLHGEIETALNDPSSTPDQREAYAGQLDEIQRLTKIVEGLTLLAKADAGQVMLAQDPVRLDELVQDSFADAQILAQSQNIKVRLMQCDAVTVCGDRHRLRQLLLNLTDNAIKYNQPHGTVTMGLSCKNGTAELLIANSGPGISVEILPRIFDRFFRGDAAHSSIIEGCGLGLSIARWIVNAHKGTIQIESQPHLLTTVSVRFPLVEPPGRDSSQIEKMEVKSSRGRK